MNRIILIIVLFTVWWVESFSQKKYAINLIPDSLKYYANTVIRSYEVNIQIIDSESAIYHCKVVKSILNEGGIEQSCLNIPYREGHTEILYISGTIYDEFGNQIKILKKDDIQDRSYYDGFSLFTDIRYKVITEPLTKPPYTIDYEYEVKLNSILSYPSFLPVNDYNVSSEKSELKITTRINNAFRSMQVNDDYKFGYEYNSGLLTHKWTVNSINAIEKEPYSLNSKQFPKLLIAPNDFQFEDYPGNAETWSNFGKWINSLINGRNNLSEKTIQEVKNLVNDDMTVYQKAKCIYQYMQQRTRYVNIALGIGGWQPNKTADTDRNGYGDCKALSLYMKSLLEVVGIESYYSLIYAGTNNEEFYENFPSNQFNHVILCLPINLDTLWLECTDQDQPFGYLGTFTDDRKALIIDSNGNGKLVHTSVYTENDNTIVRTAKITIDELGNINVVSTNIFSGLFYDDICYIINKSETEKVNELNEMLAIPNMKIISSSHEDVKERIPKLIQNLNFSAIGYVSMTSGRMFLVPNIFDGIDKIPSKLDIRKTDIVFRRGYTYIDTLHYQIPEGFIVEYLPDNISENTLFGKFEASYQIEKSELIYTRKHINYKGTYSPSNYEIFRNYMKTIYNSDKKAVVFKKV